LFTSYVRPALLTLATALLVATPLISSESVISQGTFASFHVMWLALALLSLLGSALLTESANRWTWADLCVAVLVGWHLLSAYLCDGNQRHAWNAAWQWASYGALAIVLRQQLQLGKETRALVAVMIALAVAVSLHAYYQYGISHPNLRAEFAKDPEAVLRNAGFNAEPGTPLRALAESRITSREPYAEFGLTNSLAGFLLPWLLVSLAVAFWTVQRGDSWQTVVAFVVIAVALSGVLVLTKSRTAWLAAAGGCALILLYGRRTGWQLDWRWPAGIAAVVLVIGLIAVAAKGLDAEVLSESPKSVLYRLEYWRATAALIADEPWFGVGPGNFQERYVNHKLPQASETISDPHNFLLEVWSTAGTPALIALLALMFTTAWQLSRAPRGTAMMTDLEAARTAQPAAPKDEEIQIGHFAIYAGAVVGLLLAAILGFITFQPLETTRESALDPGRDAALGVPISWITGAITYLHSYFCLQDWVDRGELPRSAVLIALIALLVNLLAAGAAIFPGVTNAAWLLWAIALAREETAPEVAPRSTATDVGFAWNRSQTLNSAIAVAVLAALIGCYYTEYLPVNCGRVLLMEAIAKRNGNHLKEAESLHEQAIAADPWSPDPWRSLAEMRLAAWLGLPREQRLWREFEDALRKYTQASPHHYSMYEQQGGWLLLASRRIKSRERLQEAAEAFEKAIKCYPNSAFLHAQLASVYAEQERTADARREADEAARLDALCPHQEQKLEKRVLHDPRWPLGSKSEERPKSAADVVDKIRGLERKDPDPSTGEQK
jgi:tetratricopeptide (TPR) repeat protein